MRAMSIVRAKKMVKFVKLKMYCDSIVADRSTDQSKRGMVEGDCPSLGYGIPYDTSLTNPLQAAHGTRSMTSIGQAEPNGIFASTNTAATWVMCIGESGSIEPHYIETKVTVCPG